MLASLRMDGMLVENVYLNQVVTCGSSCLLENVFGCGEVFR